MSRGKGSKKTKRRTTKKEKKGPCTKASIGLEVDTGEGMHTGAAAGASTPTPTPKLKSKTKSFSTWEIEVSRKVQSTQRQDHKQFSGKTRLVKSPWTGSSVSVWWTDVDRMPLERPDFLWWDADGMPHVDQNFAVSLLTCLYECMQSTGIVDASIIFFVLVALVHAPIDMMRSTTEDKLRFDRHTRRILTSFCTHALIMFRKGVSVYVTTHRPVHREKRLKTACQSIEFCCDAVETLNIFNDSTILTKAAPSQSQISEQTKHSSIMTSIMDFCMWNPTVVTALDDAHLVVLACMIVYRFRLEGLKRDMKFTSPVLKYVCVSVDHATVPRHLRLPKDTRMITHLLDMSYFLEDNIAPLCTDGVSDPDSGSGNGVLPPMMNGTSVDTSEARLFMATGGGFKSCVTSFKQTLDGLDIKRMVKCVDLLALVTPV